MPEIQIVIYHNSLVFVVTDKELGNIVNQMMGLDNYLTVTDISGFVHTIAKHTITAITKPGVHDLCTDSSMQMIELFKQDVITKDELRAHFGLAQSPSFITFNPNQVVTTVCSGNSFTGTLTGYNGTIPPINGSINSGGMP